ncbi:MAG TPA: ECF-type sigma factor [Thermoanaerobaculia bacterium]|nr:ECF-type sigma factor [Thermoanaerobaculia bacterium]
MARAQSSEEGVTGLLRAWRQGDAGARDELLDRVYPHLKRLASSQLRGERAGHSLHATDLVHEAYLRLVDQSRVDWRDRAHFFGLAATTMRRVLVDRARRRLRKKRQANDVHTGATLAAAPGLETPEVDLLDLDRALERLAAEAPRVARVVEMRYFAGLEIDEVAACLEVSSATVRRDWDYARAWMRVELGGAS